MISKCCETKRVSAGRCWHLQKGCRQPHWSLRVNGLACLLLTKGADNHKVFLHATEPLSHDIKGETFSRSRSEDTDISGKGANDDIGLCMSTGSLASSWQKARITIRYLRMLPDPRVTIAKVILFCGLGRKTLTSPGRCRWPHWSLRVNGLAYL